MSRKEVKDFIYDPKRQARIREEMTALIAIPSVSEDGEGKYVFGKNCGMALETMLALGEKHGYQTENHDYYCGSIVLKGENPADEIGIIAHLDVVPAVEGWTYPRFALTEENGLYIGRGVRDDKGWAVMAMTAMDYFREKNISLPFSVRLLVGCNEEKGMNDLCYFLKDHVPPRFSMVPDGEFPVCVGEKSIAELELDLGVPGDGIYDFSGGNASNSVPDLAELILDNRYLSACQALTLPEEITLSVKDGRPVFSAKGKSAHAAEPVGSINAIVLLAKFMLSTGLLPKGGMAEKQLSFYVNTMQDVFGTGFGINCEDELSGVLTCICGMTFVRDGVLRMNINIRHPNSVSLETLLEKITEITKNAGFGTVTVDHASKGYAFSPDKHEVKVLTEAFRTVTGTEGKPYVMGGGTYARSFPNAVAFGGSFDESSSPLGPGRGRAHERDECIPVNEFNQALEIYIESILRLAGM